MADLSANKDVQIPKMINPKVNVVGVPEEYLKDILYKWLKARIFLKILNIWK